MITFNSCLKEEPETTIFYGHQQIPNINTFMPLRLLEAFGDENLNFGDTPPSIEGNFLSKQRELFAFDTVPDSQWEPPIPTPASDIFFSFSEQHIGIARMAFTYTTDAVHHASSEDTFETMKRGLADFVRDTIAPSYFKQGTNYSASDFGHVYIMGEAPRFTAYYYEIHDTNEKPLYAVILSGRMATKQEIVTDTLGQAIDTVTQSVIVDCKYGFEAMRYYGTFPTDLNRYHYPGDLAVYTCDTLRPSVQSIEP